MSKRCLLDRDLDTQTSGPYHTNPGRLRQVLFDLIRRSLIRSISMPSISPAVMATRLRVLGRVPHQAMGGFRPSPVSALSSSVSEPSSSCSGPSTSCSGPRKFVLWADRVRVLGRESSCSGPSTPPSKAHMISLSGGSHETVETCVRNNTNGKPGGVLRSGR